MGTDRTLAKVLKLRSRQFTFVSKVRGQRSEMTKNYYKFEVDESSTLKSNENKSRVGIRFDIGTGVTWYMILSIYTGESNSRNGVFTALLTTTLQLMMVHVRHLFCHYFV